MKQTIMSEKSILEQALLQVQTLEEAVKSNAKGILASTMKQELNDLMKESLEDAGDEDEIDVAEQAEDAEDAPEEEDEQDVDTDEDDVDTDLDNEPTDDVEDEDFDTEDEDESVEDEPTFDEPSFDDEVDSDDTLDMTGASDDEVYKVFKAMKPEDGIVVKKDGEDIEFDNGDDQYIIKLDDEDDEDEINEDDEFGFEDEGDVNESEDDEVLDFDSSDEENDEEVVYEIELDGEDDEDEEEVEGDVAEAARTGAFAQRGNGTQRKIFKAGRKELNEEVSKLKKQNAEYKKALVLFKEKLNEVAVFNANLAYATRLFTENSTTKQEKLNILKRFDSVSTLKESKNLYNTLKTELDTKKPISESVVEKIKSTPKTSSTQVLAESKVYENPQFARVRELMNKVK